MNHDSTTPETIPRSRRIGSRWALLWIGVWAFLAQAVGSLFNIWYNLLHIQPLLSDEQLAAFVRAIGQVNLWVYPVGGLAMSLLLLRLNRIYQRCRKGLAVEPERLLRAQRCTVNLGWYIVALATPCWLICIPWLLLALPGKVDSRLYFHLPVSILVAALISQTLMLLSVELVSVRTLFPALFRHDPPASIPGTFPLTIRGRALLLCAAGGLCPILSLLLLVLAPHPELPQNQVFAISVALVSGVLALVSGALASHIIEQPVLALHDASKQVATGDLDVRVGLLRADEFGPLIEEFNAMVEDLRQKARLEETFGRHVGVATAQAILERDHAGLSGNELDITVMFVDIRGFTARCSGASPQDAVALLNQFFTTVVEVIEGRGGMVNKFLGDGLMALFGAGQGFTDHADRALSAALAQLTRLEALNEQLGLSEPIIIGIGLHSGPAVVGSIGAPQRMEYTAIGDTVNVAARIEALTKELGQELLLSGDTLERLSDTSGAVALAPQRLRGKEEPLRLYTWKS